MIEKLRLAYSAELLRISMLLSFDIFQDLLTDFKNVVKP